MDFGDWIDLLNFEARAFGYDGVASELTDIEEWIDLFKMDLTPYEALYEIAISTT